MSLRTKVLLLLSAIALVPALVTATLDTHLLRSLSDDLTQRNAQAMADQALVTMQRIAAEYADVLDRESRRIRVLVELQADYAERLLRSAGDTAGAAAGTVHFTEAFDRADPTLELSARYAPLSHAEPGAARALPVSWDHQVFHHPETVARETLLDDARALLPMTDFFHRVRDPRDRILRWQYVVLDNGLLATFPGHGAYPAGFDPRERPWFEAQRLNPGFRWYRPHFDVTTRALVINATMPLHAADGRFIGMTGIDIDLLATFEVLELPPYLRAGSELMQVAAVTPPQASEPRLVVLARQNASFSNSDWHALPDLELFALDDRATTETVRTAMLAGRDGHLRATIGGREHFVLYRRFGEAASYLVMTVPVARATAAAFDARRHARTVTAEHVRTLLLVLFTASALAMLVALAASRHLTRPIEHLKRVVQRLARGDLAVRAVVTTGDELQALGEAFNAMVPQLRERAHVQESLALAREVQQQLLPPAPPQIAGYDVCGVSLYSDETGGDYFDYVPGVTGDDGRLGVVVADVSGHGIAPALLMATTRALLHGARGRGLALDELLGLLNENLADDVSHGHFVTLFLLTVEAGGDAIEWASAGHDPALVYRARSGSVGELGGDGIPLGIDPDWRYGDASRGTLGDGDIVLIGTDGIWETPAADGTRFGKHRLHEFLRAHAEDDAATLCAGLVDALARFRGSARQHDDVTIVVVKHRAGHA